MRSDIEPCVDHRAIALSCQEPKEEPNQKEKRERVYAHDIYQESMRNTPHTQKTAKLRGACTYVEMDAEEPFLEINGSAVIPCAADNKWSEPSFFLFSSSFQRERERKRSDLRRSLYQTEPPAQSKRPTVHKLKRRRAATILAHSITRTAIVAVVPRPSKSLRIHWRPQSSTSTFSCFLLSTGVFLKLAAAAGGALEKRDRPNDRVWSVYDRISGDDHRRHHSEKRNRRKHEE